MGLTMYVGVYGAMGDGSEETAEFIAEGVDEISDLLEQNGISRHEEPAECPEGCRFWRCSIRYGFVEAFQVKVGELHAQGAIRLSKAELSHLLEHSPGAGYFVPIDFEHFVSNDDLDVGSSVKLKAVCEAAAKALGMDEPLAAIPLDYSDDADGIYAWLSEKFAAEEESKRVFLMIAAILYQGAVISIKNRMIFGFS